MLQECVGWSTTGYEFNKVCATMKAGEVLNGLVGKGEDWRWQVGLVTRLDDRSTNRLWKVRAQRAKFLQEGSAWSK